MSIIYLRTPCEYKIPEEPLQKPLRKVRSKCSKGEMFIGKILQNLNYEYTTEYSIYTLPKLRFDFVISNRKILIEYDSELHMTFSKYIHKTNKKFIKCQNRDALKNTEAISEGYLVIRIDYTLLHKSQIVSDFISKNITEWDGKTGKFVTVNPHLYEYLKNCISPKIISKYKKKCIL
jgi:very-short-patch-repair endonuclease